MGILGYTKAFWDVAPFRLLSEKAQKRIIARRQKRIIEFARKNTVFYGERIPKKWKSIEEIPPTEKNDFMRHFDDTVTDRRINFELVKSHLQQVPSDGTLFNKYYIATTSGSSGEPLLHIRDRSVTYHENFVGILRTLNYKTPEAHIVSPHAFSLSSESVRQTQKESSLVKKSLYLISSLDTPSQQVEKIKEIGAKSVFGYTSAVALLAAAALEMGTTFDAGCVAVSGEPMDERERDMINRAFPKAHVTMAYACTEGGVMAFECKCGHMHINSDLVLVEAVDKNGKRVPYGTPSDQTYITSYYNKVQPMIRFAVGDRITLHNGCPCGIKDDWIEVDGRANDTLVFDGENGEKISCSPTNLLLCVGCISVCGTLFFRNYQLVLRPENTVEVRLDCYEGADRDDIFAKIKANLTEYLTSLGVCDLKIVLSNELPKVTSNTGKKKKVVIEK